MPSSIGSVCCRPGQLDTASPVHTAAQRWMPAAPARDRTNGRRAGAASASVVTYSEDWSIEAPNALPVFTRSDVMGGGNTDVLEGITRYTTREVKSGGNELIGEFERDGSRQKTHVNTHVAILPEVGPR